MSTYGSRTTDVFSLAIERIIDFDDTYGGREGPFIDRLEVRLTAWGREATLTFHPNGRQHRFMWASSHSGDVGVPRVGKVGWHFDKYEAHRMSGDYTEYTEDQRKRDN